MAGCLDAVGAVQAEFRAGLTQAGTQLGSGVNGELQNLTYRRSLSMAGSTYARGGYSLALIIFCVVAMLKGSVSGCNVAGRKHTDTLEYSHIAGLNFSCRSQML